MPKSQGQSLPYTSRDACIKAAKSKGVNTSPCMKIPAGNQNPGMLKPTKLPKGGGGGMGY